MSRPVTVIKLGGALLTHKKRPFTLRPAILDQVAAEVQQCLANGLIDRLLLVHGVGSFGHPLVVQHRLHHGLKSPDQLIHLTYTQNSVMQLRLAIATACHAQGIPVSTIMPSSYMVASGMAQESCCLDAIAGFLELGMVPLLGGDILADDQMGLCLYGGDKIAVDLACHFGASRLIFATEVDGVFDRDPRQYPEATRLDRFSLRDANRTAVFGQTVDASGTMAGKMQTLLQAREAMTAGLKVHVLSMLEEGNLSALLRGEEAIGTTIEP